MVIFSHRGIGFGKKENSLEAISCAVKSDFSVEVDLRLKNNKIVLSHDQVHNEDLGDFSGLLELLKENPDKFFALHLKDNSLVLFKIVSDYMRPFKNSLLFVTDFKQDNFITNMFEMIGKEQLALYINIRNSYAQLLDKVNYLWLDETKDDIYRDLGYFIGLGKKVICCSPEIFTDNYKERLKILSSKLSKTLIFGVCTDYPERYQKKE